MAVLRPDDNDYYRILGVTRDVGEDGLKRAYKRQALRWHPDKNHGNGAAKAEERFKKVSEAYQALSDKRSRAVYNHRRPDAGSKDVLFSKTYGWPGANISFYWTGPRPEEQPERDAQRQSSEAQNPDEAGSQEARRSPFELFRDMFEIDSPLAAIDKQLSGVGRQGSIFESVFGSFSKDETDAEPVVEAQQEPDRSFQETCTKSMNEKDSRINFIQEEYMRGDLNDEEFKDLLGLFTAP